MKAVRILMIASMLASANISAAQFEFAPITSLPLGKSPRAVAIGDMDNDGLADVVVDRFIANARGISVLRQQPDGTLTELKNYSVSAGSEIVLSDLNRDGALDIAVGNSDELTVLISDGSGSHAISVIPLDLGGCEITIQLVDSDRDGDIDLFCHGQNHAYILPNNGHGGFGSARIEIPSDSYYAAGHAGDVSGDGFADVVFPDGRDLILNINRGDGTFLPPSRFDTAYVLAGVTSGDLFANEHDEVAAVGYESSPIMVFRQDGQGSFLPDYQRLEPPRRSDAAFARDLNGDGKADLLAVNSQEGIVGYYIQRIGGLPGVPQILQIPSNLSIWPSSTQYMGIATGDLDGDGCTDLVTTTYSSGVLNIARGMNCSRRGITHDYNGDGVADLLWHNAATGAGSIWRSANYAT